MPIGRRARRRGVNGPTMIRYFASAALALSLAIAPAFASSQHHEKDASAPKITGQDAAPTTTKKQPPIDYNVTHNPDNIHDLDLSNGQHEDNRQMPQWAPQTVERVK